MRLVTFGFSVGLLMVTQLGCGGGSDKPTGSGGGGAAGQGGGGGGTGGSMTACEAGKTRSCYDGPAATEGKGVCKAGSQTCKPDGSGYGACDGEVVPQPENCATKQDEDCDGKAPACSGDLEWAILLGGPGDESGAGSCVDAAGNVYVLGDFQSTLPLPGGTQITADANATSAFVVKLDPKGKLIWSQVFQGSANERSIAYACSVLPSGGVGVAGFFSGTIDFGDGPNPNTGYNAPFAAALDDHGKVLWHRTFPTANGASDAIAVAPDGSIYIGGDFSESLTVDASTTLTDNVSSPDGFLLKLDPKGKPQWTKQLRGVDGGQRSVNGIAVAPDGTVAVAASAYGPADFGSGAASSTAGADYDAVLGLFHPSGAQIGLYQFGDGANQFGYSVGFDPKGDLIFAGRFSGTLDLGDGAPLVASASDSYAFIGKLDRQGNVLGKVALGTPASNVYAEAAVDVVGNVVIFGQYGPKALVVGSTTLPAGAVDIPYVAKLDNDLKPLWARSFVAADSWTTSVAVDAQSNIFAVGMFDTQANPEIQFDATHEASGEGFYDAWVTRLSP